MVDEMVDRETDDMVDCETDNEMVRDIIFIIFLCFSGFICRQKLVKKEWTR